VSWDVGDRVPIRHYVRDPDGALTAATVSISVTKPDGTSVSPEPSVTTSSTGVYDASVTVDDDGLWRYTWTVSGAVVEVTHGEFLVGDPAPPAYAALAVLKAGWDITTVTHDTLLQTNLMAASRMIDDHCHRRFYSDEAVSSRNYVPGGRTVWADDGELLFIDDVASETGLVVAVGSGASFTTVSSSDYEVYPSNAIAQRKPIEGLLRLGGRWTGGLTGQRVRVTARWGWPATPEVVEQATLLQAGRLYKRKDSPQGFLATAEWGAARVASIDPDVARLLRSVVRHVFA
jgi:hypothetical protein